MRRLVILSALGLALSIPLSAQKGSPPGSATFTLDACVNPTSFDVSASVAWSHARVDLIQFSALSAGGAVLATQAASGEGSRDGSTAVHLTPSTMPDRVTITLYDLKERWSVTGVIQDLPHC